MPIVETCMVVTYVAGRPVPDLRKANLDIAADSACWRQLEDIPCRLEADRIGLDLVRRRDLNILSVEEMVGIRSVGILGLVGARQVGLRRLAELEPVPAPVPGVLAPLRPF